MDLMEHKREMVQMLMNMLKKSSADEMESGYSPRMAEGEPVQEEPVQKMAEGGLISPNAMEDEPVQMVDSPEEEQEHPEEEAEDIPAIARLRRRK